MRLLRRILRHGSPTTGGVLILLAAASTALLFIEGAGPGAAALNVVPAPIARADKLWHFLAHFGVATLLFWGAVFSRPRRRHSRRLVLAALVLAADFAAGLIVELVQLWLGAVHGRLFETDDLRANIAGGITAIALGLTLWQMLAPPRRGRSTPAAE